MTGRERRMVENVMEGWHVGYAFLYPVDKGKRREYIFDMTPENIASFIFDHRYDAEKIELTDMLDRKLMNIDLKGGTDNYNKDLCQRVARSLQAIMNGSEPASFVVVTRQLYNQYCAMEELAVMEKTIEMLIREEEA